MKTEDIWITFFSDFSNLLSEYRKPTTRGEKLIKHKLDAIVALYDSCSVEEREFADEIMIEFSRVIALLKNQHRQELIELSQKCKELENRQGRLSLTYIPLHHQDQSDIYEYDYEVLADFYDHFKRPGDDQLFLQNLFSVFGVIFSILPSLSIPPPKTEKKKAEKEEKRQKKGTKKKPNSLRFFPVAPLIFLSQKGRKLEKEEEFFLLQFSLLNKKKE